MTDSFVGEIQVFGFNFAPYGWAQCNGAILAISQYTALFSLIGVTYGGNGTSNFQLPNLFDRAACSQGAGPGLSVRDMGEVFGEPQVTLLGNQMPVHNHGFQIWDQKDTTKVTNKPANGNALAVAAQLQTFPASATNPNTTLSPAMAGPWPSGGGSQPHENRQPALALNYCICLSGTFPPFS